MTIVKPSAENMNIVKSKKHSISPNVIEEKSLPSEKFRMLFNFKKIERFVKFYKQTVQNIPHFNKKQY